MAQKLRRNDSVDVQSAGASYEAPPTDRQRKRHVNHTQSPGLDIGSLTSGSDAWLNDRTLADILFDVPVDTLFLFDPSTGKPLRWNKKFSQLIGYTDEEIARMKAPDDFYAEVEIKTAKNATIAALSEESGKVELSLLTKQGALIPFEYTVTAVQTADGKSLLLCIGRDVTERKRADVALRESVTLYSELARYTSSALDGLSSNIAILDAEGRIELVNQAWRDFAEMNPPINSNVCEGADYLASCDKALGADAEDARKAGAGIRGVLSGDTTSFVLEYPCHSPATQRWFSMHVTRFPGARPPRAIVAHVNITERVEAEESLRRSEDHLCRAELMGEFGSWEADLVTRMVSASEGARSIYGAWGGRLSFDLIERVPLPEYRQMLDDAWRGLVTEDKPYDVEFKIKREVDDAIIDIRAVASFDKNSNMVFAVIQDVTQRRLADEQIQASEKQYRRLFEAARDGILILNTETSEIIDVNPFIESLIGYSKEELVGKNLWDIGFIKDETASIRAFEELKSKGYIRYEDLPLESKDGRQIHVEFVSNVYSVDQTSVIQCNIRDITERKMAAEALVMAKDNTEVLNQQLQEALVHSYDYSVSLEAAKGEIEGSAIKLSHQATHDALTGLPNREYFEQHLNELVTGDEGRKPRSFVVLFLDLDRFKIVNDTLGHKVGDMLLVDVAARLQSCLRSEDILARLGGDEFTVILPRGVTRETAEAVAARVIDSISRPFQIHGHRLVIGVSVGLADYPSSGADTVALVKHADAAMYSAKQSGRGKFCWYSGDMDVEIQRRADMEADIRTALDEGQFNVHYQPIMCLADGKILAAEALLRWDHPVKGMISPSLFIPTAEEIGVMGRIGQFVLRTACAQTMAWRDEGIHLSQMAVNVSTSQVCDSGWLDSVCTVLSDTGLDPQSLNLEVTETDFAVDYQAIRKTLSRAHKHGISMAIDDFGTGHSSLRRLKDFPVVLLKIDGSFVRDIEYNTNDNALVRSIVDMAHGQQGVKVIAEWVETESQMEILRTIGCDYAQGFFISPPLAAEEFGDFVRDWTPAQLGAQAVGSIAR